MSKKNNILSDSDITKLLKIPSATIRDWKKTSDDNWRNRLYHFLKSHSYSELELRVNMIQDFIKKSS